MRAIDATESRRALESADRNDGSGWIDRERTIPRDSEADRLNNSPAGRLPVFSDRPDLFLNRTTSAAAVDGAQMDQRTA
jgi:hypothetical protein